MPRPPDEIGDRSRCPLLQSSRGNRSRMPRQGRQRYDDRGNSLSDPAVLFADRGAREASRAKRRLDHPEIDGVLSRGASVEAGDPFIESGLVGGEIFLLRDPPVNLRIALGLERRVVLVHEVHVDVRRDLAREKAHHLTRFRDSAGHHDVPHEQSAAGEPFAGARGRGDGFGGRRPAGGGIALM